MEKIYYHRVPGARFIMPDGTDVRFSAEDGRHATERTDVQFELDRIANVPSSQVFTKETVAEVMANEANVPVMENRHTGEAGFDGVNRVPPGTQTQEMLVTKDPKPVVNKSNVDPDLAGKLAAARAAVASNNAPPTGAGSQSNAGQQAGGAVTGVANTKAAPAATK